MREDAAFLTMATTKLYLDMRKVGKDSDKAVSLKLALNHRNSTVYITLPIQLTKDQWNATESKVKNHPQKNIVTQSIGQADPVEPDIALKTLEVGDYVLINSDGLTNMVSTEDIRDILLSDVSLESKAETLVRFANNAGGLDNITVAILHITEEAN